MQFYLNRYLSWWTPSRFAEKYASRADSDTEFDETFTASKLSSVPTNRRWKIVQWFAYLTTFIAIWFRKTVDFFKFRTDGRRQYYSAQAYQYYNGMISIYKCKRAAYINANDLIIFYYLLFRI